MFLIMSSPDAPSRFKAPLQEKKSDIEYCKKAIQAMIDEALQLQDEQAAQEILYEQECLAVEALVC